MLNNYLFTINSNDKYSITVLLKKWISQFNIGDTITFNDDISNILCLNNKFDYVYKKYLSKNGYDTFIFEVN